MKYKALKNGMWQLHDFTSVKLVAGEDIDVDVPDAVNMLEAGWIEKKKADKVEKVSEEKEAKPVSKNKEAKPVTKTKSKA